MMNVIPVFRLLTSPRQTVSKEDTIKFHKNFQYGIEVEETILKSNNRKNLLQLFLQY